MYTYNYNYPKCLCVGIRYRGGTVQLHIIRAPACGEH